MHLSEGIAARGDGHGARHIFNDFDAARRAAASNPLSFSIAQLEGCALYIPYFFCGFFRASCT